MFEIIEKELSRIANVLEKLVEQPVKRQRKATVKKEEKKIEVVQESEEPEDSLGLGLGDAEPAPQVTTIVRTEEDIRTASKALIDTAVKAGDTQRKGYDAAAVIIELYGESVKTIPEEKRSEAINALQEKACGWEKK